tara:strand:+ start:1253 stop:1552 length:300 start_codon:yes stop_codon:yes gene_type:complete
VKGRTPNKKEKQHMDAVSQLGCIVCRNMGMGYVPCEIHHINGKTKKDAHLQILPLCFEHHRRGENNPIYVSRHPYKAEFVKRYGKELELLEQVNKLLEE